MELAERFDRLWAAIIDRMLYLVPIVAGAIAAPGLLRGNGSIAGIAALVFVAALIGVQCWLLTTRGQTIGKRAVGLRIVLVKDLSNGGFVANVLLRTGVPLVIAVVPVAGLVFSIADPLFIFREDRRCVHDHIAGTCVIKA